MPDLNLLGVLEAALVPSQQLERRPNDGVDRIPVFNAKEVDPLDGLRDPSRFLDAALRAAR